MRFCLLVFRGVFWIIPFIMLSMLFLPSLCFLFLWLGKIDRLCSYFSSLVFFQSPIHPGLCSFRRLFFLIFFKLLTDVLIWQSKLLSAIFFHFGVQLWCFPGVFLVFTFSLISLSPPTNSSSIFSIQDAEIPSREEGVKKNALCLSQWEFSKFAFWVPFYFMKERK